MYSPLRFLPSVLRKNRPLHLVFFVTRQCNARCPFCFYLEGTKAPPEGEELSRHEAERVAASLGPLLWLALSGGEIFLRQDLAELAGIFYDRTRPSVILLPTNGLMPNLIRRRTEEILRRCPRSVVTVKLSIDALGEKHDNLRGVPGAFGKVLETYRSLAPLLGEYRNFELGVNTVFSAANQDEMDDIIELVQGLEHVRTHTVSLVRGELADAGLKDVDMSKYLRTVERLEQGLKDRTQPTYGFRGARIKAAQDILQRRIIYRTVHENRRQIPCYAGRLNLTLTETGDVYPCEDFSEAWRLGNVRDFDYRLDSLAASAQARRIISRIGRECYCTHECYVMTNILFNPSTYPLLLAEAARLR